MARKSLLLRGTFPRLLLGSPTSVNLPGRLNQRQLQVPFNTTAWCTFLLNFTTSDTNRNARAQTEYSCHVNLKILLKENNCRNHNHSHTHLCPKEWLDSTDKVRISQQYQCINNNNNAQVSTKNFNKNVNINVNGNKNSNGMKNRNGQNSSEGGLRRKESRSEEEKGELLACIWAYTSCSSLLR